MCSPVGAGWESYIYFKIDKIILENDNFVKNISTLANADFQYKSYLKKLEKKQKLASHKKNRQTQIVNELINDLPEICEDIYDDSMSLSSQSEEDGFDVNPFALLSEQECDLQVLEAEGDQCVHDTEQVENACDEIEEDYESFEFTTKQDWHTPKLKFKLRNH
jgi:hypothetical protein